MDVLNLLLLLLGLSVPVNLEVILQKRIFGGQKCNDNERQYHVKLIENYDVDPSCGGSLISDQWILTAAHCWEHKPGWFMTAALGHHPKRAKKETMRIVDSPVVYIDNDGLQHDIMLLKLPKKSKIRPALMPRCQSRPKVGDTVQLAGYGPTSSNSNNPPTDLQCVEMKVVNDQKYIQNKINRNKYHNWYYQHLIIAQSPSKDICYGDSGGGVEFQKKIYGVISNMGDPTCISPAGIMDVCAYINWIDQIISP